MKRIILLIITVVYVFLYLSTNTFSFDGNANLDPVPDIKANGSDGPVAVPQDYPLSITTALVPGSLSGSNADWWVVANTPFPPPDDWYYYDLSSDSWLQGQLVTYQGPLFDLSTYEVMNMTLPAGAYTFYFGVDMLMNGSIDMGQMYYDSVEVEITGTCQTGTDSDNDRLDDCYETDTGVYVSPTDTGTDPNDPDTDGDAIDDGDEVLGTLNGLNLPGMGANPLRQDIFIEYDWFDDSLECGSHSHRPTVNAANMVAQAFANGSVLNPDGSTGVTLHNDRGQGGFFTGGNLIADADGVLTGGVNSAEFQSHKAANFDANREGYFHYVILPHRYNSNSGSSGQAELPGDDLIVSLYCAHYDSHVANTIMHELGHNLLLRHGGNTNCNYKPNYNSVMNYKYQFPGIDNNCTPPGDGVLSYSIGDRINLNENNLNENLGTCGTVPWDWNGINGIESSVIYDINSSDSYQVSNCGGTHTTLSDYNDWGNLYFIGLQDADGMLPAPPEIITCNNPVPVEN